jgi:diguanylate cyclase (GGDEF)-like protein
LNGRAEFRPLAVLEAFAPFAAGFLLSACGVWAAARALGLGRVPASPLGELSTVNALLLAGAGVGLMFAAWELFWLRRAIQNFQSKVRRAGAERDLALLQARRMRAQAEGLALMREIHRSTAIPERHDRLHRILTLVGDLFEAREVALFAATPRGTPLPVLPAAYLRSSHQEEVFAAFETDEFARALEDSGSGIIRAPKIKDATLTCVGCWLYIEGQVRVGERVVASAQGRRSLAGQEVETARLDANQMLGALLSRLDYSPAICKQSAEALEQRRTLRHRESFTVYRQEGGDEALVLCVPLMADQRPVGVLRIRRQADGFDGPAAEALEEMLIESAKHIALAMKKDEDDRKAITDQLTGLYIKRHFVDVMEQFRADAVGEGKGFALVLCDIDHFKKVNDSHGHLSGDVILKGVAGVLRGGLRAGDLAFRYGGEEMVILMPGASQNAALQTAERLRQRIEKSVFKGEKGQVIPVTISMGLALFRPGLTGEQLISRADRAMYASKHNGRNQVTAWRADLPDPLAGKPAPVKAEAAKPASAAS